MAIVAEPHRDDKAHPQPFTTDDFCPYALAERAAEQGEIIYLDSLKDLVLNSKW